MASPLLDTALIGIGATVTMDLFTLGQKHLLRQPSLDYAMVGRWLGHLSNLRLIHRPITASPNIPHERALGWAAHYLIGLLFAFILALLTSSAPDLATALRTPLQPTLGQALAFGAITTLFPFLILQPCLGAGLAARRTPRPNLARLKSLATHLSFGFGLWLTATLLTALG